MEDQILRPCPLCGDKNLALHSKPSNDNTIVWWSITHTSDIPCGISLIDSDKGKLLKRWNGRAVPAALIVLAEAVEDVSADGGPDFYWVDKAKVILKELKL